MRVRWCGRRGVLRVVALLVERLRRASRGRRRGSRGGMCEVVCVFL
jgi:hypothetical protein